MSSPDAPSLPLFSELGLSAAVQAALAEVGYESPSPIQAATIPALLAGRDLLGTAQTGTGKTAAFALPILSTLNLDAGSKKPQALVLAPTRELAIQVAEAFQRYASKIPGFNVLPIYGGQSYQPQLQALRRGVHVVVGTPGRVIDHLDKGTLDLSELTTLVLDEADEMLRMGFIDDVESVLKKTPESRQVALFSATMPAQIRRIAQTYLREPAEVNITAKTTTATNITQRYWFVSGMHKLDALTRILEAEPFDAMIIFARTKAATDELAQKLQARGLAAAAINGDIQQAQREKTIQQLKDGKLDVLVATDVAARGLDVDRITHVLNYDIPYDTESYVHRIGRTGRAGRKGEAILFVSPREKGMLRAIERATRQPIEEMQLPSVEAVNDKRVARFIDKITGALEGGGVEDFRPLIENFERERNIPAIEIAAALAKLVQGDEPLLLSERKPAPRAKEDRPARAYEDRPQRPAREGFERKPSANKGFEPRSFADGKFDKPRAPKPPRGEPEVGMETFRIEVGHVHGVKPANIVGAIANEAGLESKYIGRIDIHDDYTTLDLPEGMPRETLAHLKKVWVSGQQLRLHKVGEDAGAASPRKFGPKGAKPGFKPAGPKKPHRKGPPKARDE